MRGWQVTEHFHPTFMAIGAVYTHPKVVSYSNCPFHPLAVCEVIDPLVRKSVCPTREATRLDRAKAFPLGCAEADSAVQRLGPPHAWAPGSLHTCAAKQTPATSTTSRRAAIPNALKDLLLSI